MDFPSFVATQAKTPSPNGGALPSVAWVNDCSAVSFTAPRNYLRFGEILRSPRPQRQAGAHSSIWVDSEPTASGWLSDTVATIGAPSPRRGTN